MPILARETALFPDDLLTGFEEAGEDREWWAVCTRSRQEKALARDLIAMEIPFYLPLVPNRRKVRNRVITSHMPLFSGYIFVFADPEQQARTISNNRVSHRLPVVDGQRLRRELHQIRELIEADAPLTLEQRIQAGRRVRIKSGSLKGIEGIVLRRQGRTRLLVSVNYLQQGVSVEIDDFMVESV